MRLIVDRFKEVEGLTLSTSVLFDDSNKAVAEFSIGEPNGPDTTKRGLDKRIPQGVYQTDLIYSPKNKCYVRRLYNDKVPKDRMIEIHIGNTGEDTLGCLIIGMSIKGDIVFQSRIAFNKFMDLTKDKDLVIEIRNNL